MNYWLLKTEPHVYSWQDLKNEMARTSSWEGIRNYQARNYIRAEMKSGDLCFIYHSAIKPPYIVGIAEIVRESYPDHYAFEFGHEYFDPKSDPKNPVWFMVDIKAIQEFKEPISIDQLKVIPELRNMVLLNNSRLSVQPVSDKEWHIISALTEVIVLD